MKISAKQFRSDEGGATAVEFALVSIIFIGSTLGVIDMARYAWEFNSAKAASRAGARLAVVTPPAVAQLVDYDAIAELGLGGGSVIPADSGPPDYVCNSTSCSAGGSLVSANFLPVYNVMRTYYRGLQPQNVEITYRHVGLGTAGNPHGSDIEPVVTVTVRNMTFQPMALQVFGVTLPFPTVATTLTSEDLA